MQQEIAEGCQSTFLHKDHSPPAKLVKSAPNDLNWGNPWRLCWRLGDVL